MRRLTYLGYYLKEMDWAQFRLFLNHAAHTSGRSKASLLAEMLQDSLRYNISLLEYFQFRFYEGNVDKNSYAGTGYMYEYQKKMNPPGKREILEDKGLFLSTYAPFIKHKHALLTEMQENPVLAKRLLQNPSGKLILKHTRGQCGRGVEVISSGRYSAKSLISHLKKTGNDMAEEFVEQHPDLAKLSPSGLNTLRLITQLNEKDEVDFLGARLRISVNSHVDNLAAGNIAAPVDMESGIINGPAVYSDITKEKTNIHPHTQHSITGFKIPYWEECLQLTKEAALYQPQNRSIGWDIAVTASGPDLIEGNHDWCKLLWQLPAERGLKSTLDHYLNTLS